MRTSVLRACRLLTTLAAASAVLASLATAPSGAADPAPAADPTSVAARGGAPGPGDDFPRMPDRCYDDATGRVLSPCRLTYAGPNRPWVVAWGDSHTWMYTSAYLRLAQRHRLNLVAMYYGSCPVSVPFGDRSGEPNTGGCDTHNATSLDIIRELVRRHRRVQVVVGGFWAGYRHNYALTMREERTGQDSGIIEYHQHMAKLAVRRSGAAMKALSRLGIQVDLIAPAATVPVDARPCAAGEDPYQCDLDRAKAFPHERANKRFVRDLAVKASSRTATARVIDPSPLYVRGRTVLAHVDGVNTFFDQVHLGNRLARRTTPWFRPVFRTFVRR
jgi:hypothetical protein